MTDLLELVKDYYLSPLMGNSNSIKYVLPAALMESVYLRKKYSQPVYGTPQIPSLNFKDKVWIKMTEGVPSANPYEELPPLFSSEDLKRMEDFLSEEGEDVKNGGAAMMAYCKSQFTQMSEDERNLIRNALLKYCELDTLAMVMLVEYWLSHIKLLSD
jgi:hypothetical protein